MPTKKITMVDPMQIVRKGYKGCNSSATVKNFAIKNNVACCWWKPKAGQKVLLIEMNSFQSAWKAKKTSSTQSRSTTKTTSRASSTRGTSARSSRRISAKSTTARSRSSWNGRTRTASRSNTRSSARRTSARRLRRAA